MYYYTMHKVFSCDLYIVRAAHYGSYVWLFLVYIMKKILVIFITLIIVICVPATFPRLCGYEVFNVVSGSMEPQIPVGSAVFVKGQNPEMIKDKDIISFYSGTMSQGIVTHRVISNNIQEKCFITKGDANEKEDLIPVEYSRFIGKVVFSVPFYGYIAAFISSQIGKIILILILFILIFVSFLSENKNKVGEKNEKEA